MPVPQPRRRPVEVLLAGVLAGLLGMAGIVTGLMMDETPLAAAATLVGALTVVLAIGTAMGSQVSRVSLLVVLAPVVVILFARHVPWPAAGSLAAVALLAVPPRVRAWFR